MVRAAFRLDAGVGVGGGHLTRCAALAAEMEQRGWATCLVGSAETVALSETVEGFANRMILDGPRLLDAGALPGGQDVLVVDHYGLGADYEERAGRCARLIVAISDHPERPRRADIVVDQNVGHAAGDYCHSAASARAVLAGADHVMLRPAFRRRKRSEEPQLRHPAVNLLVTFGASDPQDITGLVLRSLRGIAPAEWHVRAVLGPSYSRVYDVERLSGEWPALSVERAPPDLLASMAWCDAAIAAVGGTLWELCYMGVPFAVLTPGSAAHPTAERLHRQGAAIDLGASQTLTATTLSDVLAAIMEDRERRTTLAANAFRLIDGRGASRVCDSIEKVLSVQ